MEKREVKAKATVNSTKINETNTVKTKVNTANKNKKNSSNKFNYNMFLTIILFFIVLFIINTVWAEKPITLIQLASNGERQSMGYLLKTQNNLIVIDGGLEEDSQNLIENIESNGGKVDYWFITHAHDDHAGAFTKIVNETQIQIENIYVSLNDISWYEQNEPERIEFTKKLFDTLENDRIKSNVHEPSVNGIIKIDDVIVEILGVKNPEFTENAGNEQSMVIKFNTTQNSILILGDTGEKSSQKLLETQKEKLKSTIVQMAHHGQNGATQELYKQISPEICLWPTPEWLWNNDSGEGENSGTWKTLETRKWMEDLNVKENYVAKDGNKSIEVE